MRRTRSQQTVYRPIFVIFSLLALPVTTLGGDCFPFPVALREQLNTQQVAGTSKASSPVIVESPARHFNGANAASGIKGSPPENVVDPLTIYSIPMKYKGPKVAYTPEELNLPTMKTIKEIEAGKLSREDGINRILDQTEFTFREKGVVYRRVVEANGHQYIVIEPIKNTKTVSSSDLNRLANGILKYDPNFELRYDPARLHLSTKIVDAGTVLDQSSGVNYILIGHLAAAKASSRERDLVHEVIHGKIWGDLRKGKITADQTYFVAFDPPKHLFRTGVLPSPSGTFNSHYKTYLEAGELKTYRISMQDAVQDYAEAIRAHSPDSALLKIRLIGIATSARMPAASVGFVKG